MELENAALLARIARLGAPVDHCRAVTLHAHHAPRLSKPVEVVRHLRELRTHLVDERFRIVP